MVSGSMPSINVLLVMHICIFHLFDACFYRAILDTNALYVYVGLNGCELTANYATLIWRKDSKYSVHHSWELSGYIIHHCLSHITLTTKRPCGLHAGTLTWVFNRFQRWKTVIKTTWVDLVEYGIGLGEQNKQSWGTIIVAISGVEHAYSSPVLPKNEILFFGI